MICAVQLVASWFDCYDWGEEISMTNKELWLFFEFPISFYDWQELLARYAHSLSIFSEI